MQKKLQVNVGWLRKTAVCLAFFGFLTAQDVRAWGPPPVISTPPLGISVLNGGTITLTTLVGLSVTPVTVKWYFNGNELKNANVSTTTIAVSTLSTLTIPNATSALSGSYTAKVENGGGEVTTLPAIVIVLDVFKIVGIDASQCRLTNGGFQLQLFKPAQSNCVLEASSDFIHWTPVYTNTSGSTNFSYLDNAATNLLSRYYRARLQ